MLEPIDRLLNRITMYKLVLYYLIALVALALLFGLIGWLPYDPRSLLLELSIILALSLATNTVFARVFGAPTNSESVYITALILTLIIQPPALNALSAAMPLLIWASIWAMASKYIFAFGKKHLFNPAAFGVAVTATTLSAPATWWVGGNLPLLPFVLVGGILVVRKIRRGDLVIPFFIVSLLAIILFSLPQPPITTLHQVLVHTPLFFFAFVMLTEPLTTPPTRTARALYGGAVGFLFAPMVHIASVYSTPELALLIGNLFSYLVSSKRRYVLRLARIVPASAGVYDFVFEPEAPVRFRAGQYLEWTLAHPRPDWRGNRRYFTIASAPEEREVRIGVKFYKRPSSFKQALLSLPRGNRVIAAGLAGDFTLPKDPQEKLAFIAGGIGITPFRSMVRHLIGQNERRSITLLYSNRRTDEIAYQNTFARAAALGVKTTYVITEEGARERIDENLIRREIPDFDERTFFVSGPQAMVQAMKRILRRLGVKRRRIKTDYFPGL